VYNDFRSSVLQILSTYKSPAPVIVANGTVRADNPGTEQPEVEAKRPNSHIPVDHVPEPQTIDRVSKPETFPRVIFVVGES